MKSTVRLAFAASVLVLAACETVDYKGGPDPSPPTLSLLVRSPGKPDVEVGNRSQPIRTEVASPSSDFSVLATARDGESGIREITLKLTRTVCFVPSGGGIAKAPFATVTRKQAVRTDPHSAPISISVGDSGYFDRSSRAQAFPEEANLAGFRNANQNWIVGVGFHGVYTLEAKNFASGTPAFSDTIIVTWGDLSCNPP